MRGGLARSGVSRRAGQEARPVLFRQAGILPAPADLGDPGLFPVPGGFRYLGLGRRGDHILGRVLQHLDGKTRRRPAGSLNGAGTPVPIAESRRSWNLLIQHIGPGIQSVQTPLEPTLPSINWLNSAV